MWGVCACVVYVLGMCGVVYVCMTSLQLHAYRMLMIVR